MTTTLSPRFDRLTICEHRMDDMPNDCIHMAIFAANDFTRHSCGSSGCLAGHAVTWFPESGIYLDGVLGCPKMNERIGSLAFAELCQIPEDLAMWLCTNQRLYFRGRQRLGYTNEYKLKEFDNVTPCMVANRIREAIIMLGGEVQEDYPIETAKVLKRVQ